MLPSGSIIKAPLHQKRLYDILDSQVIGVTSYAKGVVINELSN